MPSRFDFTRRVQNLSNIPFTNPFSLSLMGELDPQVKYSMNVMDILMTVVYPCEPFNICNNLRDFEIIKPLDANRR